MAMEYPWLPPQGGMSSALGLQQQNLLEQKRLGQQKGQARDQRDMAVASMILQTIFGQGGLAQLMK